MAQTHTYTFHTLSLILIVNTFAVMQYMAQGQHSLTFHICVFDYHRPRKGGHHIFSLQIYHDSTLIFVFNLFQLL